MTSICTPMPKILHCTVYCSVMHVLPSFPFQHGLPRDPDDPRLPRRLRVSPTLGSSRITISISGVTKHGRDKSTIRDTTTGSPGPTNSSRPTLKPWSLNDRDPSRRPECGRYRTIRQPCSLATWSLQTSHHAPSMSRWHYQLKQSLNSSNI